MKVALVYDRVNKFGGAERLLLQLHKVFPDAPLYTLVHNPRTATWASHIEVIPSFFNKIKFLRTRHQLLALLAPLGFESFDFRDFDLVISLTSESAKCIITKPDTLHICYCLTPTRYLWSAQQDYLKHPAFGLLSPLIKPFFKLFRPRLKKRDYIFAQRPDKYLAISKTVQKRIEKFYNRQSQVIYPPVNYQYFSADTQQTQDFYLLVSRLESYKKTSIVVKAFNQMSEKKLKIVGTGSQINKLQKMAKQNIQFLGHVSDQHLRSLYSQAKALVFPQLEDFGIVPLEAQAAGTPVIAYKKGGATETVIEGKTGLFFKNQTPSAIIKTIGQFENMTNQFSDKLCQHQAENFNQSRFQKLTKQKTKTLWENHQQKTI